MITGHLCCHQLFARRLALGVEVAHAGLFVIWQARHHRPRRHKDRRDMAKGCRRHHKAGHNLVADTKVEAGVKGVVAHRHARRQGDHIARKERQLHSRLALGHPVAHRRNATRHLRRGPHLARGGADQFGVIFKRLMGREHIIISGDDADIGCAPCRKLGLLRPHGRIGMGLIAASQMPACGPRAPRGCDPREVSAACRLGSGANAVSDPGDGRMKRHGSSLNVAGPRRCWAGSSRYLAQYVSANK